MTVQEISLNTYYGATASDIGDLLRHYLSGEPVFIKIANDERRTKSVARLVLDDETIQNMLHGEYDRYRYYRSDTRARIEPIPENVDDIKASNISINGYATWDGRKNRVNGMTNWNTIWLKGHEGGTVWSYEKPEVKQELAYDKLGREIAVGDFISYILYQFQGSSAAGIYYGKVTKIDKDGTVYAKNIKLDENDRVAEKAIKENSLIVIMTKDLMDKLMLARLAIL